MNLVYKYKPCYKLESDSKFMLVIITDSCFTSGVWSNEYVGEVFVCYKDSYGGQGSDRYTHRILDNKLNFHDNWCYVQVEKSNFPSAKTIKSTFKRPANWDQYLEEIK